MRCARVVVVITSKVVLAGPLRGRSWLSPQCKRVVHCSRLVIVVLDSGGDGMSKRSRIPPRLAVSPKYTVGFLSFGLPRL